jgi:lysozyme
MQASDKCYAALERLEGRRLTAYRCPAGVWTIGVGHTDGVVEGAIIDDATCNTLLHKDVAVAEVAIARYVTAELTQSKYDALVCWTLNEGAGALAGSTLLKLLNAGQLDQVPAQWMQWCYARDPKNPDGPKLYLPGLHTRRLVELALWQGDMSAADIPSTPPGTTASRPPGAIAATLQSSRTIGGALWTTLGAIVDAADQVLGTLNDIVLHIPGVASAEQLLTSFGFNGSAVGKGLMAYGIVSVVYARVTATLKGKIG